MVIFGGQYFIVNPAPVRKEWILNGHKHAEKVSKKDWYQIVLKNEESLYTCKIYD